MIGFIFGTFFGSITTIVTMCILAVGKEQDNDGI